MSKLRRLLLAKHLNEINEDDIMMTADSNPEVMRCCYLAGFAKSPYFMTYKEAANVTDTAKFNAAFNNSNIVNFNEAKYFTGITGVVNFTASLLKDFSFLPNCNGYEINGKFPNCTVYNFEMGKSASRRNGPETIANNNILKFLVNSNNYYWYIKNCHLGYGQCICKKGGNSVLWETPNPKDGIFIYPYEGGQSGLSVSMTFMRFQGHTIVQNTSHYFGNAYMSGGGRNLKKIISFTGSSYYTTIPNYIGADVKNEPKVLIVPTWDPIDYENTTAYTTNFLNPNVCNFQLKRVNFGITIYNEKVLFKFNGLHEDEFFMTQEECAEITTLSDRFTNSDIEEFIELQYFTSLDNIDNAFYGCSKLKTITLPSHITTIGDNAFANCSSLASISIPEGVTTIGNNAFANCSSLTSIEIPSTVTYIGDNAFSGCVNISTIKMNPTTAPTLGENVWGDNESNYIGTNVNSDKIVDILDEYVGYDTDKWSILINILGFTKLKINFINAIISNGTLKQYIDTRYVVQSTDEIYIDFEVVLPLNTQPSSSPKIYGWRYKGSWNNNNQFVIEIKRDMNNISIYYGTPYPGFTLLPEQRIRILVSPKNKQLYVNGEPQASGWDNTFTNAYNSIGSAVYSAYLFATNSMNTLDNNWSNIKLYEYYVKDKLDNYTIHLMPVLDYNNKACMYDTVTKEFFYDENGNDFYYEPR